MEKITKHSSLWLLASVYLLAIGLCVALVFMLLFSINAPSNNEIKMISLITIWDTQSGKQLASFEDSINSIVYMAYLPDSTQLMVVNTDGVVKIFDSHTGKVLKSMKREFNSVRIAAHSPDGQWLATYDRSFNIALRNLNTKDIAEIPTNNQIYIYDINFSEDGSKMLVARRGNISLYETGSWKLIKSIDITTPDLRINGAKINDNVIIASARERKVSANYLLTIDIETGKIISKFKCNDRRIVSLSLNNPRNQIAVAGTNGAVKIYEANTQKPKYMLAGPKGYYWTFGRILYSRNGSKFAAFLQAVKNTTEPNKNTPSALNRIMIWDAEKYKFIKQIELQSVVDAISISPDGKYLAASSIKTLEKPLQKTAKAQP